MGRSMCWTALSEALKDNPKARDLLREGANLVRQQPDRLEDVLTDLLRGPLPRPKRTVRRYCW